MVYSLQYQNGLSSLWNLCQMKTKNCKNGQITGKKISKNLMVNELAYTFLVKCHHGKKTASVNGKTWQFKLDNK